MHRRRSYSHGVADRLTTVVEPLLDWYSLRRGTLLGNLAWGVAWGLFLAAAFSVIAAVPALIRALVGPAHAWQQGLSLVSIVGFYVGAALVGGALVGLLRPLGRWWFGRRLLGIVIGIPLVLGVRYVVYGMHPWTSEELESWIVTGLIWGVAMSFAPEPFVGERRRPGHR